jgi:hypothetical protein
LREVQPAAGKLSARIDRSRTEVQRFLADLYCARYRAKV